MAIDEQHVALPKLYGAPAYARPPRHAEEVDRPFDPDDLPIEVHQTDEERYLMNRTKCTELDMGCEFTLEIFFDKNDKRKKRPLRMHVKDPMRALLIQSHAHAKTNQTNFFGASLTCEH